ncbi:MAG: hypothetical protein PHO32_06660 [Candidatus Cloacimonetes bacterium]|nr:hypothetical protein [Candidatus Cloacimonadota bacterium]
MKHASKIEGFDLLPSVFSVVKKVEGCKGAKVKHASKIEGFDLLPSVFSVEKGAKVKRCKGETRIEDRRF